MPNAGQDMDRKPFSRCEQPAKPFDPAELAKLTLSPMTSRAHLAVQLFRRGGIFERIHELSNVRRARRLTTRVGNHAEARLMVFQLDPATSCIDANVVDAAGRVIDRIQ